MPPRRSLFAPVRPTLSFPGKVGNFIFYYFFLSNIHPWTLWCRSVPSKSQYSVVCVHGFRSPVVESREPPGVGTAVSTVSIVRRSTLVTSV